MSCIAVLAMLLPRLALADSGYRLNDYRAPVPDSVPGGTVVHTAQLPHLIATRHPVLIDVLPAPKPPPDPRPDLPRLPLPHRDLPGSIWLPDVGRGEISPQAAAWFAAQLSTVTHGDKTAPVVFYCLSQCWMSWNATKRAATYGYTHAIWYPEGADGWIATGHPSQTAIPASPPKADH